MEDYKVIGEKLKNARMRRNVTQMEMAEYTGASRKHISEVENGITIKGASVRLLLRYCEKLNLTPNDILGIENKGNDDVINGLNRYLSQLTDEQKAKIEDFLRSFNGT